MSIQLQGNAESTFANDVTIGGGITTTGASVFLNDLYTAGDLITDGDFYVFKTSVGFSAKIGKDGSSTFAGEMVIGNDTNVSLGLKPGPNGYIRGLQDGTETFVLKGSGAAAFKASNGYLELTSNGAVVCSRTTNNSVDTVFQVAAKLNGAADQGKFVVRADGDCVAKGQFIGNGITFNLDTGGTLDVKERLQNTQAILYRIKAALIQPDADANQLRTRLLEALDILTSDGDES